jgi:protein KTI12
MRFEEPSSMVRWDSPLFTIAWDEEPPYDAIWESITKGAKAPPTAAVKMVRRRAAWRGVSSIPISRG